MGFRGAVAALAGGTAASQALTLAVAPVLSRLYAPDAFGIFSVYASLVAVVSVFVGLRLDLAIHLPEDDDEAAEVLSTALAATAGCSLVVGAGVWLGGPWLAARLGDPRVAGYLWVLPASLLGAGVFQAFRMWGVRRGAFRGLAAGSFVQAAGQAAAQVIMGLGGLGPGGLIGGEALGRC
ncbi:lipopolysaccharide biosynthesis protein, partial [Deferrisoma palaeochoriense]